MSRSVASENPFVSGGDKRPATPPLSDETRSERTEDDVYTDSRSATTKSSVRRAESFGEKYSEKSSDLGTNSAVAARSPQRNIFTSYAGSFAPNPSFIRLLRFLLYGLASLSSLATAGVAISVVAYYNMNRPSIPPSWGSLIALIVFGIITPGAYFIPFLFTPRMFRYGTVLGIVNQVRIELLLLFGLAVIWVSGALAMANDLRGYENCIWDGYYHYPKPADFNHVCDLINATVAMGYTTFGLVTLAWFVVTALAVYILLYLDQEVLSELTNDMGGRAYRARTYARQSMQPPIVAPTNVDGYPGPAAPSVHRRASSSLSRRSPMSEDFERGDIEPPYTPRSGSAFMYADDDMPASRRIPNPDAAVPMSEKRALAERYGDRPAGHARTDSGRGTPGPMA